MSNLPISSKYRSQPDKPLDEADREEIVSRINDAFVTSAIPGDDYRGMLDRAYAARTMGELAPIAERLPVMRTHEEPAIVEQAATGRPGEFAPAGMRQETALKVMLGVAGGSALLILLVVLVSAFG